MNNQDTFIPLGSPDIRENDIQEVVRVLKSGMLVQGKEVERLENIMSSYIGIKHCIAVSNGTATMHLLLKLLNIGEGDEVIVPAFSYIATANVVELVGATPVFVDIDIKTFNIDTSKIEQAITNKTKAIIPVHEFGLACDIFKIKELGEKYNIFIIEDAACALGAEDKGKFTGTFGKAGSFSLHPRKAITSGEGGLITTNDDELAAKLRVFRNHGIEYKDGKMNFVAAGFNYRMTDFQASLAASQFSRLPDIIKTRNELANIYFDEITNPLVTLPENPEDKLHTWQTFHLLLNDKIEQVEILDKLKIAGIGANYGAQCIPLQSYYFEKYQHESAIKFPNAFKAFNKGLAIPLYEKLTRDQIKYISSIINKISN